MHLYVLDDCAKMPSVQWQARDERVHALALDAAVLVPVRAAQTVIASRLD